jgi:hypothetical protein
MIMVVYFKMLNGKNLKHALGMCKVRQQYHNKNKGGGNFGINMFPAYKERPIFCLDGDYNLKGEVYKLRFSKLYCVGMNIL